LELGHLSRKLTSDPKYDHLHGRERILRAALKLFSEFGYAGTSIRDIASEAGVSLGLIRIHFGAKEELRAAVDRHALGRVRELYITVLDHSGGEPLERVSDDTVKWISSNMDALLYARMTLLEKSGGGQLMFSELFQTMLEFIEQNEKRGFLQQDIDKKWAAFDMVFDFIGPLIIEPLVKKEFGESMYSKEMIIKRNEFLRKMFIGGIFKQ